MKYIYLALTAIACLGLTAGSSMAASLTNPNLALYDAINLVSDDGDVCKKLNGKSVFNDHTISATCEPGETLLCSCEITSNNSNSKYKNCKEYETGDTGRVECTCNDAGTGYTCKSIIGLSKNLPAFSIGGSIGVY